MGTLFNQKERSNESYNSKDIIFEIELIQDISYKTGLTYDQVVQTMKMLEMRRKNDLYKNNGDAFDEQMMGFGELIQEFIFLYKEVKSIE